MYTNQQTWSKYISCYIELTDSLTGSSFTKNVDQNCVCVLVGWGVGVGVWGCGGWLIDDIKHRKKKHLHSLWHPADYLI